MRAQTSPSQTSPSQAGTVYEVWKESTGYTCDGSQPIYDHVVVARTSSPPRIEQRILYGFMACQEDIGSDGNEFLVGGISVLYVEYFEVYDQDNNLLASAGNTFATEWRSYVKEITGDFFCEVTAPLPLPPYDPASHIQRIKAQTNTQLDLNLIGDYSIPTLASLPLEIGGYRRDINLGGLYNLRFFFYMMILWRVFFGGGRRR